jgi:hypothetical protein
LQAIHSTWLPFPPQKLPFSQRAGTASRDDAKILIYIA